MINCSISLLAERPLYEAIYLSFFINAGSTLKPNIGNLEANLCTSNSVINLITF